MTEKRGIVTNFVPKMFDFLSPAPCVRPEKRLLFSMTKKDYILIADILASVQNQYMKGRIEPDELVPYIAKAFCELARLDNPRFDSARFLSRATVAI